MNFLSLNAVPAWKTKSFDNEIDKEYYDKEPNPNDKDYEDSKPEQLELKDNSKPLKFSEDEIDFLATKFPKKYVKVLERILNSKRVGKFEPNIKSKKYSYYKLKNN